MSPGQDFRRPAAATATATATALAGWRGWVAPAAAALAFVAGFATDALSTGRRVNLLAAPMLGLLAWNLAVYLWMLWRGAASGLGRSAPATGPIARAMLRAGGAAGRVGIDAQADAARAAQALHLASAALAAGMLAGLYLRGLAFEYLAGWESTFLDARQVRALLGAIHGPASALTGITLPDATALAAIRFGEGPGERAGRWIHLHAASLALYVILPRLLLAVRAGARARRLAREAAARGPGGAPAGDAQAAPPADDAPFTGVAPGADGAIRVLALPYSYALPGAAERGLRALLAGELGAAASLELAPSLSPEQAEAGADALAGTPGRPAPQLLLALFAAGATPEPQTHAAFVAALAHRLPRGTALRVLVDETAFRARFAGMPQRLAQRREAWRAVFGAQGIAPRFAALGDPGRASPLANDGSDTVPAASATKPTGPATADPHRPGAAR